MSTSLQDRRGHIARAGDVFSSSGRLFHSRGFGACRVMTSCIVSMSYCNSSVRTTTALNVKHCCRLVGTSVPVGICFGSFSQPPAMFCAFSSPPRRVANYAPPPPPAAARSMGPLLATSLSLYRLRSLEPLLGSKKFAAFVAVTSVLTIPFEASAGVYFGTVR